jgi:hypothetical protein
MVVIEDGFVRVPAHPDCARFEWCGEIDPLNVREGRIGAPFPARFVSFGTYSSSELLMLDQVRVYQTGMLICPMPLQLFQYHYIVRYFPRCWCTGQLFTARLQNRGSRVARFGFTFEVAVY